MDTFAPADWFNSQLAENPVQIVEWTAYAFAAGVLFHWKLWPALVRWMRGTLGNDLRELGSDDISRAIENASRKRDS